MAHLIPNIRQKFFDANGIPLAGGKLYTYQAGTTTPLATYTDQSGSTPNANPVILDANGEANVWIGEGAYKFVLKDSSDVTLYSIDGIQFLEDGSISTVKLEDDIITTSKILNDAVTTPKIVNNAITTAKVNDGAITAAKLAVGAVTYSNMPSTVEVVFKNSGDFSKDGTIKGIPQFPWATPNMMGNPSALPAGTGRAIAWSPNGQLLLVGNDNTPFRKAFERKGNSFWDTWSDLSPIPGNGNGVAWCPTGTYIAFAHPTSPYLSIYQRDIDTFDYVSVPTKFTLPTGQGNGVAWSHDGQFVAIAHANAPYFSVFQKLSANASALPLLDGVISGFTADGVIAKIVPDGIDTDSRVGSFADQVNDTNNEIQAKLNALIQLVNSQKAPCFYKLSDATSLPTGTGRGVSWSSDKKLLAVAHDTSPYVSIYQWTNVGLAKIADPASLPAGDAKAVAFSPNGKFLAIAHQTSPYLTIYSVSGTTFTKLSNPATLPPNIAYGVAWSPNGKLLAVAHTGSPYVTVYSVSGTTFTKLANPSFLPPSDAFGVAFSPNGEILSVAHATSPYVTNYQTSGTIATDAILIVSEVSNV